MRIVEAYELMCRCPADEKILLNAGIGLPEVDFQSKINARLEAENIRLRERNEALKDLCVQQREARKKQKVLSQENARLLMLLRDERESHEQSLLLAEKRLALVSVRNDDKKPLTTTQGVKNAYSGSYAERVRAKRF